jgi:HEPN domain-containing protein
MTVEKKIPMSGPAFEAMMVEIDAKLTADRKDITDRPLLAVREVSMKFDVSIPLGGEAERMPADLRRYAPLSDAISRWYQEAYGDRLKVDPCPGRMAILLDGDLYTLRIPRIFGGVEFVISRGFLPEVGISSKGPVACNIVQLVDGMTPAKAARLSDDALEGLCIGFERALPASYTLECTQHELMYVARGDVATALNNLMDRGERYGQSKWASLLAAEKMLKAAIALQNGTYSRTHQLALLRDELRAAGIDLKLRTVLDAIQCDPSIRYGNSDCTREQALAAHHASLDLVNMLRDAGAKFELGLGGPDDPP